MAERGTCLVILSDVAGLGLEILRENTSLGKGSEKPGKDCMEARFAQSSGHQALLCPFALLLGTILPAALLMPQSSE